MKRDHCGPCVGYLERRGLVIARIIVARHPTRVEDVLSRYMAGVHERHLVGLSLEVAA